MLEQIIFTVMPITSVPTSSGKPGKIGKVFPVREISGNLKILQNIREKTFQELFFIFFILYTALPIQMHFWETFWFFFI